MNDFERSVDNLIVHITQPTSRQRGQTTALIAMCIEQDGLYVVETESHARNLRQRYPKIRACRFDQVSGVSVTPIFIDHLCWQHIASKLLRELTLAKENGEFFKEMCDSIKGILSDY